MDKATKYIIYAVVAAIFVYLVINYLQYSQCINRVDAMLGDNPYRYIAESQC